MKKWIIWVIVAFLIWHAWKAYQARPLEARHEQYLKDAHPKARGIFRRFIREIENKTGFKVQITSLYRTPEHQARLYAEDNRNARPYYSMHNYGLAIDMILSKDGTEIRKATPREAWERTGVPAIANKYGLIWGADFAGYYDPVHFDVSKLYNVKPSELYKTAQANPATPANQVHF